MKKENEKIIAKEIGQIYRHLQMLLDLQFNSQDFGRGQYLYIIYILNNPGINQEILSSILKIDKGTTARAVKKLCDYGYVVRKRSEEDKRAWKLYPSEKSVSLHPLLKKNLDFLNRRMLENFSTDEKKEIFFLMDKLMKNIETIYMELVNNEEQK